MTETDRETLEQAKQETVAVIMAGGSGTRFWPVSDEDKPKQFLQLFGEGTMLQQTVKRLRGLVPPERTLILTNQRYVRLAREQVPEIPPENVVGEPMARDTAAAVALGAILARHRFQDCPMTVLPADHLIYPVETFQANLISALSGALGAGGEPGSLYTFGIVPTYPATGYGYLAAGEEVWDDSGIKHREVLQFKEKPDPETACHYVNAGTYFWNSGIFVWRTQDIISELQRLLPGHVENLERAVASYGKLDWDSALAQAFEPLEKTSIDFGVMERAQRVNMVQAQFEWDDLGGWNAVGQYLPRDEKGNAYEGKMVAVDSKENVIFSESQEELVALVGVENLVVVRSGNRTLVVPRERAEDVKKLVEKLGQ